MPTGASGRRGDTPPRTVEEPLGSLLARLDGVLWERAPSLAEALRPGLTVGRIAELESSAGIRLNADLRTLHAWHDGTPLTDPWTDSIPSYWFVPLGEAISNLRIGREQQRKASFVQRVFLRLFGGRRDTWLALLWNFGYQGVFCDVARGDRSGAIFCWDVDYELRFPCLANLVAAITRCYEENAYRPRGQKIEEPERAFAIWEEYGWRVE